MTKADVCNNLEIDIATSMPRDKETNDTNIPYIKTRNTKNTYTSSMCTCHKKILFT